MLARFFPDSHLDVIGIAPGAATAKPVYRVDGDQLAQLDAALASATDLDSVRAALRDRLDRLRWQPAASLIGPLEVQATNVGQRLGKLAVLRVVGGDLAVPPEEIAPIIAVLPHLVRNAVDHGLEESGERGAKSPEGTLVLEFKDTGTEWQIVLTDDGRGIDVEKLRAKALALGILRPTDQPTHDELCALIFASKLSTADEVSEISGRGEGMAAVAHAVASIGAAIVVQSTRASAPA